MSQGDRYAAVGGTVTLPLSTINIESGGVEKHPLNVRNTTGPGDGGNTTFSYGNIRYGFSVRGTYAEGSQPTNTLDDAVSGAASIAVGNGEEWSGNVIITRLRASPAWGPGGDIGVILQGVFTGAVTIAQPGS